MKGGGRLDFSPPFLLTLSIMIRIKEIIDAFSNLVGWEGVPELEKSDSGLYFQEAHPLLTLRALKGVMPKDKGDEYPSYEEGKTYSKGERVNYAGTIYESLVDDNLEGVETASWAKVDLFTDYLRGMTARGIKKAITRFVQDKIVGLESRNIVDRRTLFDGAGRKEARVENMGKLVGFEITPIRDNGITTLIDKVGLQFYGNVGKVKLYLFHSSQSEPIETKEVEYTNPNGGFMWFDLEWTLPYISKNINAGGSWYVVYEQGKLPPYMEAINFGRDWSKEPCGTCNKGDLQLYRMMSKYITLSPFYVAIGDWDGKLWDISSNIYTYGNNYGLNFMITMACDLTGAILMEKAQFANVIQLQVATEALRTLALNPEVSVNRVQSNAERQGILFELVGDGQGIRGLNGDLEKAYKALSIDTKGFDPICLGCHNKGIRYGSI